VSGLVFVGVSALKLLVLGAIVPPYAFGSLSSTETSSLPLPPPSLGAIVFVRCTTRLFVDVAAFAAVVASSHTIAASAVGNNALSLLLYITGKRRQQVGRGPRLWSSTSWAICSVQAASSLTRNSSRGPSNPISTWQTRSRSLL